MSQNIDIPKQAMIIIIEGIAGSGKTTLFGRLQKQFKDRKIYAFQEEELLLSWKHNFVPNITEKRFEFLNKKLDLIKDKLDDKNVIFILERFHISLKLFNWFPNKCFNEKYSKLISRIKELPVHMIITTIAGDKIGQRSAHTERKQEWTDFQNKRNRLLGYTGSVKFFAEQQEKILKIAAEQKIPFSEIKT